MVRVKRVARAHPWAAVFSTVVLVLVGGVALVALREWRKFAPVHVDFAVPSAPTLQPQSPDQTVYRIDPSRSKVSYAVDENLAGTDHTATASTSGVAGDILVDKADPAKSQVGEIVVNVEQFSSDQSLRDNRIRHEFLESERYPLATFKTNTIDGLPTSIAEATDYQVTLHGDLTVKTTTKPVDVKATVRRDGDEVHVTASTSVKLSDFGAGPIHIVGLASTGDDADLTFQLTAVDATKFHPPATVAGATETFAKGGPSFSKTVQPVLQQACASCHQPKGSGSGEWQLATAADAARAANGLALATQSKYMPPWPASDVGVALQHPMTLSQAQIDAIKAWADAGGPLDVDPSTPVKADVPDVQPPRHDLELRLPQPYQATPANQNDYRCFVLDPKITTPTVVTGYEFMPDQVQIVHHALIYRLSPGSLDAVNAADANDPGPGWQCYGGINVGGLGLSPNGRGGGADLVMGYGPGQTPTQYAPGTGLVLDPGDIFVVQMHYHATHDVPPDDSGVALQFGPGSPADYRDVQVTTMLAPAEIPCAPDTTGPLCDRNAEIDQLQKLYGPVGPLIANGLNVVCGTTPEQIGVLDANLVAHSSCDHRVNEDGKLLSVLGHMHEMGLSFRMTLNPGTPDQKVLLDIPRWDFDWQFNYGVADDITLHKGDNIRIECSWDRHLAEESQAHYVTWAEGTEDEMCFSTIATVPLK